jgi:hypothetical protein
VRTERPDDGDAEPSRLDAAEPREIAAPSEQQAPGKDGPDSGDSDTRAKRALEYRAEVDSVYRTAAIDRAYERVREIEQGTVTPAMRRIEAGDPDRHLAGLDHRLKGKDRLTEKVEFDVQKKGRDVEQAVANVKDTIRYTFVYNEETYTAGVYADCQRLDDAGFGRFDRRNSWEHAEYKGINSRWHIPGTGQLFEVQFHTQASLDAKEETHSAYERIRSLPEDDGEVAELHTYQREVTAKVPVPPDASDIPDYRY